MAYKKIEELCGNTKTSQKQKRTVMEPKKKKYRKYIIKADHRYEHDKKEMQLQRFEEEPTTQYQ